MVRVEIVRGMTMGFSRAVLLLYAGVEYVDSVYAVAVYWGGMELRVGS